MNIFFSASSDVTEPIKNGYRKLMEIFEENGFTVSQSIFGNLIKKNLGNEKDFNYVYDEVLKKIDEADILVADISYPSGGVGYQIYHAFYQKKPVIIIYKQDDKTNPSVIIRGIKSKKVLIISYDSLEDLKPKLVSALDKARGMIKIRFNLVMKSGDYSFIERESKRINMTKTRYLNKLIKDAEKKAEEKLNK